MTATRARVSAGSAGWSAAANRAVGPRGRRRCGLLLLGPGSDFAKSAEEGWGLAEDLHLDLDGQLGRDVRGRRAESAAFSETYHSPGAGNFSSL